MSRGIISGACRALILLIAVLILGVSPSEANPAPRNTLDRGRINYLLARIDVECDGRYPFMEELLSQGEPNEIAVELERVIRYGSCKERVIAKLGLYWMNDRSPRFFVDLIKEMQNSEEQGCVLPSLWIADQIDENLDAEVFPIIESTLNLDDPGIRAISIGLMARFPHTRSVISHIVDAADDPDDLVRRSVSHALKDVVEANPDLIGDVRILNALFQLTGDTDYSAKYAAWEALELHDGNDEVVQFAWQSFRVGDEARRVSAIKLLSRILPEEEIVPLLLDLVHSENEMEAAAAIDLLPETASDDEAIPALLDLVGSDNQRILYSTINALSTYESRPEIINALVQLLVADNPLTSYEFDSARHYLMNASDQLCEQIPCLVEYLDRGNVNPPWKIEEALSIIGSIGPPASNAVNSVLPYADLSWLAEQFADYEYSSDVAQKSIRGNALYALASIEPSLEHLELIADALIIPEGYDEPSELLESSLNSSAGPLGKIFGRMPRHPELLSWDQQSCIAALSLFTDYPDEAASLLNELLAGYPSNRAAPLIRASLFKLGYNQEENLDSIIDRLYSIDPIWSMRALAAIGPPAVEAIPYLEEFLCHEFPEYRASAQFAIARIEGEEIMDFSVNFVF